MSHVVKVHRYGGGESVLKYCDTPEQAQELADYWNMLYQTETYYVEEYDEKRVWK